MNTQAEGSSWTKESAAPKTPSQAPVAASEGKFHDVGFSWASGPWSPSLLKIKNLTMKKIMKKAYSRLETQALSLPSCISMVTFKWVILCTSAPSECGYIACPP